ncbi:MAG: GIY-YIG nuclease family protein [Kofleriaceae bacterium]|nr:GIY-YIG nuclease family protein [Kofleriaceae bacterium]
MPHRTDTARPEGTRTASIDQPTGPRKSATVAYDAAVPRAPWFAYVLVSVRTRRTYVGVTTDVVRRTRQHNGELAGGARSTRAGRPWRVGALHGPYATRGEAQSVEHALRRRRGLRRLDEFG